MIDDYLKSLYMRLEILDRTRQENNTNKEKYRDTIVAIKHYLRYGIKYYK